MVENSQYLKEGMVENSSILKQKLVQNSKGEVIGYYKIVVQKFNKLERRNGEEFQELESRNGRKL